MWARSCAPDKFPGLCCRRNRRATWPGFLRLPSRSPSATPGANTAPCASLASVRVGHFSQLTRRALNKTAFNTIKCLSFMLGAMFPPLGTPPAWGGPAPVVGLARFWGAVSRFSRQFAGCAAGLRPLVGSQRPACSRCVFCWFFGLLISLFPRVGAAYCVLVYFSSVAYMLR